MARLRNLLRRLGPGFITGASDDDPSGIATYSQIGAQFGYSQLWTALFSTPLMIAAQEMCGRIGLVTGKGLAAVIRERFPRHVLYAVVGLLCIANTVNIGADLGAMAATIQLFVGIPSWFLLIAFVGLIVVLEVFVPYHRYATFLKYLTLSLFAYIATAFVVQQDWGAILRATLLPSLSFSSDYLLALVAVLGTTISPYLFFWQADEEVEEEVAQRKIPAMGEGIPEVPFRAVRRMRFDTAAGMVFSNVAMFFIIVTAASTLGTAGIVNVGTAAEAAEALQPLAGSFTFVLFALGIVGTGLLAIPVLAGSAAYAVSEAVGWREGLYRKFHRARGFYGVIIIATAVGLLANFLPIPPFRMLYYAAAVNGVLAPPLLYFILRIANRRDIMGVYANGPLANIAGSITILAMGIAAVAFLVSLVI
jgi:NRAMP (natural resistance-associated macrophage protein)-like metal ion transporter